MAPHGHAQQHKAVASCPRHTHLHHPDLLLRPGVHGHGADEGEVDPQAPVLARALQAHEHAIRHRGPLGAHRVAVHAALSGQCNTHAMTTGGGGQGLSDDTCTASHSRLPPNTKTNAGVSRASKLLAVCLHMNCPSVAHPTPSVPINHPCGTHAFSVPAGAYGYRARARGVGRASMPNIHTNAPQPNATQFGTKLGLARKHTHACVQ